MAAVKVRVPVALKITPADVARFEKLLRASLRKLPGRLRLIDEMRDALEIAKRALAQDPLEHRDALRIVRGALRKANRP